MNGNKLNDDELDLSSSYVAAHEENKRENEDELGGSSSFFDLLLQCNALSLKPKD
jgi:hypothetical protein